MTQVAAGAAAGAAGAAGPLTFAAALDAAADTLRRAGIPAPRLEARLLLCHVVDVGMATVIGHPERRLDAAGRARLETLVLERARRRPLAQILGMREFWSLPIGVTSDVLVPRPESETLVEAVLERVGDRGRPTRVLDLGTGSGCLLLALLSELPAATGIGVDRSRAALRVARDNAVALGLVGRARFVQGDWTGPLRARFDIIVANPPYVPTAVLATLEPEVARYEPHQALDGGADGLAAYRALIPGLAAILCTGAVVALEVGAGQAAAVAALLRDHGLADSAVRNDLAGVARCVIASDGQPPGA
ncbi:MAG: peptide chain release factor N(5)-glutamine methyltransferase [Rhodospirillales bacterium]|nr:MAG: peptide chain release factor N(5)-glutamine methyltransferase [Rhodospirillales bacterium]